MRQLVAVLAVVAAVFAALGAGTPAASGAPVLSYVCSPPLPASDANCSIWHTGPVTIRWDWDQRYADPVIGSDCTTRVFSQDTKGLPVSCTVKDIDGNMASQTVMIRIDATPPVVADPVPARPPDHDGWWNHPVDLVFRGTDATSGIAGCDVVTYAGPDRPDAQVAGACRDRAGNTATRSFPVKYDATPPSLTGFTVTPGNRSAIISWAASPDTVVSELVRAPGVGGAASTTLYAGLANTFTDPAVTNGNTYRYTVSAYDAAGNAASAAASARPSMKYALSPALGARLRHPPVLRWPPVARAAYYNVQLFRGKRKILSLWPTMHHLRLHQVWRFHGHRQRLKPGNYRWFVWPGFGARAAHRYGSLIASLRFSIDR